MKKSEIIRKISPEQADVVLLGVPFEGSSSAGRLGTSKGPNAVINQLHYYVEEFDYLIGSRTCDTTKISKKMLADIAGTRPKEMISRVEKNANLLYKRDIFPITIGGDHSVSIGAIKAAKEKYNNITVVQIDAHLDLRPSNADYAAGPKLVSEFAQCTPMYHVYNLGCSLVQIGIRAVSDIEQDFINKQNIGKNIFYANNLSEYSEIIEKIKDHDIYLTVDVDGFDPSVFPATTVPEPGGISWNWFIHFAKDLFTKKNVIGFDIVEVNPWSQDEYTEFSAAKLLYYLIGLKFLKRNENNSKKS